MTWQIHIPHRSRDESLIDVASHARTLEQGEDRQVCRQLVIQAHIDGIATTAGELIDHIGGLEPNQRRALLDRARTETGLEPTEVVDRRAARRAPLTLPATATPTTRLVRRDNGTYYEEPLNPARWTYGPSGQLVELNAAEADAARQRTTEETARVRREHAAQERAPEAAAAAERRRARDQAHNAELPAHLRRDAA